MNAFVATCDQIDETRRECVDENVAELVLVASFVLVLVAL